MIDSTIDPTVDVHCTYNINCCRCHRWSKAFSITHNIDNIERWICRNCNNQGTLEVISIKYNTYWCTNCGKLIDGHNNAFHSQLCDTCWEEEIDQQVNQEDPTL